MTHHIVHRSLERNALAFDNMSTSETWAAATRTIIYNVESVVGTVHRKFCGIPVALLQFVWLIQHGRRHWVWLDPRRHARCVSDRNLRRASIKKE